MSRSVLRVDEPYRRGISGAGNRHLLDANESWGEESLAWLDALAGSGLHRYPSTASLREKIAARHGVSPEQVLVTAGSDEAIDRLCRVVLRPGTQAVVCDPTFEMLIRDVAISGAEAVRIPWLTGDFPCEAFVGACLASDAALAGLVSPSNPTGEVVSRDDFECVAAALPRGVVLADFAYVEFADSDFTADLLRLPNVVVTRTFSKAWGLAGARVGYALGPAPLISRMEAVGGPYPVSTLSLRLAEWRLSLGDPDVSRVRHERRFLESFLGERGAAMSCSQGNFVFGRTSRLAALKRQLESGGFAARFFPGSSSISDGFRLTCPGHGETFDALVRCLDGWTGRVA